MKRTIFLLFATLFIAACANDDGGGGGGAAPTTQAVTPLNRSCLDGTAYCNNQQYGRYQGWMPYPGQWHNQAYNYTSQFQNGFCNCPYGTQPVYNNSYGLGCVNASLLQPYNNNFQIWGWASGSIGWGQSSGFPYSAPQMEINYPQYSNIPQASNPGSCWQTVTQSCIISEPNTCNLGSTCRPVFGNSNLGVCAR